MMSHIHHFIPGSDPAIAIVNNVEWLAVCVSIFADGIDIWRAGEADYP
jgi:hypothetical protein